MSDKAVVIRFTAPYKAYNTDEEAGFPAHVAAAILVLENVDGGPLAVLTKGQKLPRIEPAAVVVPDNIRQEHDQKIRQLVKYMRDMDPQNMDYWTDSGLPKVDVLSGFFGASVTKEERDEAWAEVLTIISQNQRSG